MIGLFDFVKELGLDPKRVAACGGGEYHSACPSCGGHDRFIIQPNYTMKNCTGRYICRQCDIKGDTIQFCRDIIGLEWQQAVTKCHARVLQSPILRFERPISKQVKPPPMKWQEKARLFVDWASKKIEQRPDILNWLEKRGISRDVVHQYQIGYSENPGGRYGEFRRAFPKFGLPKEVNGRTHIWIPKGIVIPTIEPSGAVVRLKIRRDDWQPTDNISKYVVVSGSMQGMNLVGDRGKRVMAVVESEF